MDTLTLIRSRRSVRRFSKTDISGRTLEKILEAGRFAPSGLNNQPWKFMILDGKEKDALAEFTHYSYIVKGANKLILVFLDRKSSYNPEKDLMAIGACIQNMLLCIHSQALGACWLGEILNQRSRIQKLLKLTKNLSLKAVLAVGNPLSVPKKSNRKTLSDLIIKK